MLAAVDEASELLNNTRTVCRSHYVHPDVLDGYTSGELARFLDGKRLRATKYLVGRRAVDARVPVRDLENRAGDLMVS